LTLARESDLLCIVFTEEIVMLRTSLLATAGLALAVTFAVAQGPPTFKVVKVELVPNSEQDPKNSTFFRDRPIIEAAPSANKGELLKLPTYRSYRFIVTIEPFGELKAPLACLVRTECVRDGKVTLLGKASILYAAGPSLYACYNVFPAEGGEGDCTIRTVVEWGPPGAKDGYLKGMPLEFKASIVK
jgi:hypothetical protein